MSPETPAPSAHLTPQTLLVPAIEAWRIFILDQSNSINTVKAFVGDMLLFASFLAPDRSLGSIGAQDIQNFLQWLQNKRGVPCSPKTLARRITSIKAFFRWLHKNGILLVDPAEQIIQHSVLSPLPQVLRPAEVEAVLKAADAHRRAARPDARPYVLLSLLLATGVKKSECLALSPNHVDLEAPSGPLIFVRYASPQNRYKERKINLPEDWLPAYAEYCAQYTLDDRLFPWSPRRLEYLLEDIGEEAGLDKHLSFDMCRWTCALLDWQANKDHNEIRQKLGVSKIQWRELRMKLEQLV